MNDVRQDKSCFSCKNSGRQSSAGSLVCERFEVLIPVKDQLVGEAWPIDNITIDVGCQYWVHE